MNKAKKIYHLTFRLKVFLILLSVNFSLSYAQGPGTPEAASFEPIDATDMVNLVTGDFTYVLPLLNVPSPEGGYPIALSYHAGIAMEQEASWVGLGWNINPGAINRSVNGYADDWSNGKTSSLLYDVGGSVTSFSIGYSVGISDLLSVGESLSFTENRTYGGETSYSLDYAYNITAGIRGTGIGISASIGTQGIGLGVGYSPSFMYTGADGNAAKSAFGAKLSLSAFKSFKNGKTSYSASAGLSINKQTSVGLSFSSSKGLGVKIGTNTVGLSGTKNQTNLSYNNTGINGAVPINGIVSINFGYNRTRYWLFDNQYNNCYGTLYPGDFSTGRNNAINPEKVLSDNSESLYSANKEFERRQNNLAFISKDNYRVSGQGISGNISPGVFDASSMVMKYIPGDVVFLGDSEIGSGNVDHSFNDLYFYFENSFSSYLKMKPGEWQMPTAGVADITDLNFVGRYLENSINVDGETKNGYNSSKKRKRDGQFIEVFTNAEINGFNIIEVNADTGFDRNSLRTTDAVRDGIGAYRITTLDGKTYHYSLPVYQKEKFTRNSEIDESDENRFQEQMSITPYATHWLLTAITGPDYIDVNSDGKLDDGDYGYWVEFEYGKWSDGFTWSTPSSEKISNIDKNSVTYFENYTNKTYSWGVKEIYYLDKVRTRTHTALFVKEERDDNTATEISFTNTNYINRQIRNVVFIDGVGYLTGFESPQFNYSNYNFSTLRYAEGRYTYSANMADQKTLKLKEILILNNKDITSPINKASTGQSGRYIGNIHLKQTNHFFNIGGGLVGTEVLFDNDNEYYGEYYNNVLDANDINLSTQAQEIIEFNYEDNIPLANNAPNSTNGKLTLKGVAFKGKSGVQTVPSFQFNYQKNYNYNYDNMDDWGFDKNHPDNWSLNEIKTPIGSSIKVTYEADDYFEEVAPYRYAFNNNFEIKFTQSGSNKYMKIRNHRDNNSDQNIDFTDFYTSGSFEYVNVQYWVDDYVADVAKECFVSSVFSNEVTFILPASVDADVRTEETCYEEDWVFLKNFHGAVAQTVNWREPFNDTNCNHGGGSRIKIKLYAPKKAGQKNGGGIRVKQLELTDGITSTYTNYYYNAEGSDQNQSDSSYQSSGVTSYAPSRVFKEIKYINELPMPSVMYNRVSVANLDATGNLVDETIYKFKTLNTQPLVNTNSQYTIPDVLDINIAQDANAIMTVNSELSTVGMRKFEIRDNISSLGQLLSKESLNSEGHILSKIENKYTLFSEKVQGVSQESFDTYKRIVDQFNSGREKYQVNTTTKITHTSVLESTSQTAGGHTITQYFDTYDFLTGQVLKTRTYTSDGIAFKTESTPAYTISNYTNPHGIGGYGMGSKVDYNGNKNMLSQQAMNKTFMKVGNNWELTGVGITTWNNKWNYRNIAGSIIPDTGIPLYQKVWRKHKTFVWDGGLNANGTLTNFTGEDDNFNWTVSDAGSETAQSNSKWLNISTITLYDHYSAPLEVRDINGNYGSTKMSDGHSKVIQTANARYTEAFYSGAEYDEGEGSLYLEQEMRGASLRTTAKAHTGSYAIEAAPGDQFGTFMRANEHRAGKYKLSVWVHKDNYGNARVRATGSSPVAFNGETIFAGDWVLLHHYFDLTTSSAFPYVTSNAGNVYYDDLRIAPISATMTSYVYNQWNELSYIIDDNGLATHYKYNAVGELEEIWEEVVDQPGITGGFKKESEYKKNYKIQ